MIHIGDCLEVMKSLESASIDAIVTDPPYGLSFMGKNWDHAVPGVPFWQEALRVAKPGCHILAAGGSRTYHRLAVAIEDAGWEIRDCIMWIYGSGFPKSHNLKDEWQGWGTALKPAFEPFILARKPLDGTVAQNVQRHGCGGLNVDGCRVATDELTPRNNKPGHNDWKNSSGGYIEPSSLGRWPANVIHDGSDEVMAGFPDVKSGGGDKHGRKKSAFCASSDWKAFSGTSNGNDSGSAARFFYCPKASKSEREAGLDGMEEKQAVGGGGGIGDYLVDVDSASGKYGSEKSPARNHHPTVKPVALMAYLCRLITPPNGTILDPFCGSGSTGVAAVREGFNFIGIELNPEYAEIANRRIENEKQKTALLK